MAAAASKIAAIAGALVKSIIVSAIVIGLSVALMSVSPALGVMAMLVFTSIMLVRASRKDTPLNAFTALLPGGMALVCYLLQLAVSGIDDPTWPLAGAAAGGLPGWLVGRGHRTYMRGRQVFAHRTSGTVLIWVLTLLLTQGTTLLGLHEVAGVALGLGAFSTAMLIMLSAMLFRKVPRAGKHAPPRTVDSMIIMIVLGVSVIAGPGLFVSAAGAQDAAACRAIADTLAKVASSMRGAGLSTSADRYAWYRLQQTHIRNYDDAIVAAKCHQTQYWPQITRSMGGICSIGDTPFGCFESSRRLTPGQPPTAPSPGRPPTTVRPLPPADSPAPSVALPGTQPGGGSRAASQVVDAIADALRGARSPGEGVVASGVIIALLQLLSSTGVAIASAAAQATAAQAVSSLGTRILEGDDAIAWLKDKRHGYLDDDDKPTRKFTDFMNSLPSESGPGLQGFAGDLDSNGNPTPDKIAITVLDDGAPPLQPAEPEPPTEPEQPPPPAEQPQPPEAGQPPPPLPPLQRPTKIEEPTAPDKPKDEERPEKKDEVKKEPCQDQWVRQEQICDECDALLDEVRRLQAEENSLRRAYYNKKASKWLCAIADTGNVIASILTAPLTTFAGSAPASVLMTGGFEGLKLAIRRALDQDATLEDALWSAVPSAASSTSGGSLSWLMEALVKASNATGADQAALEKAAGLKFFRSLGPLGSVATTAHATTRDWYTTDLDERQIEQRLDTISKLRRHSRWILKEAQQRQAAADKALEDCLKRTL